MNVTRRSLMDAIDKPELDTIATLTTGHLTKDEAERLNDVFDEACPLAGGVWGTYGWWFYAGDFRDVITRDEWPGLYAALEAIEPTGAKFLRLDCDGHAIAGLPVYNW